MDLALTDAEAQFKASVRSFVQRQAPRHELAQLAQSDPTWNQSWWSAFASAGWTGILIPEEFGGAYASPLTAVLLFSELGRGPVPGPLLASSAVSAALLCAAEPCELRSELLRGIADGSAVVIPALRGPERSWRGVLGDGLPLTGPTDATRLSGTRVFVPHARSATHYLISLDRRGLVSPRFAVVRAGERGLGSRPLDGLVRANYELSLESVDIAGSDILTIPAGVDCDDAMAAARLAIAAYQVGGCEALLEMCLAYSGERAQFGVPIGRFQYVQDHVIQILNALDTARWAVFEAAWAMSSAANGPARSYLAAAVASESYVEAANAAHEVHAAIGSDPAFGLTLYTCAARSLYDLLGSPGWSRQRLSDALGWAAA